MSNHSSSDDFFNSFGNGREQEARRHGPPAGPPPPTVATRRSVAPPPPRAHPPPARPPPPPPSQQQQQQQPTIQQDRSVQQQPPQRRPPPLNNPNSYVLSSGQTATSSANKLNTATAMKANVNTNTYQQTEKLSITPNYYGGNVMTTTQPQQPSSNRNENSNDDWYTPSLDDGLMQPQQQQQQQQVYNNEGGTGYSSMMMSNYTTTPVVPPYNNTNPSSSQQTFPTHGSNTIQSNNYLGGSMDPLLQPSINPSSFIPTISNAFAQPPPPHNDLSNSDDYDILDEPPLLEELGINLEHIYLKAKAVIVPFQRFHRHSALTDPTLIVEDADLAGPLALAMLLGGELVLSGKLQFGSIYGFGMFGCLAMTTILNLMSPSKAISFWTVTSILGYALIPVNVLAAVKLLFIFYLHSVTNVLAIVAVLWSTTASTRLLELGCGLKDQRYLLAYPIALLYSAFVLITIF